MTEFYYNACWTSLYEGKSIKKKLVTYFLSRPTHRSLKTRHLLGKGTYFTQQQHSPHHSQLTSIRYVKHILSQTTMTGVNRETMTTLDGKLL